VRVTARPKPSERDGLRSAIPQFADHRPGRDSGGVVRPLTRSGSAHGGSVEPARGPGGRISLPEATVRMSSPRRLPITAPERVTSSRHTSCPNRSREIRVSSESRTNLSPATLSKPNAIQLLVEEGVEREARHLRVFDSHDTQIDHRQRTPASCGVHSSCGPRFVPLHSGGDS
jgi:hypothetical protein